MDEVTNIMFERIREIDERDENQVLAELAGETVAEFIYITQIKDPKTKKLVDKVRLSWVGVRETARDKGNIILEEPITTENDDSYRIVVAANDLKRNFRVFGGCHQPKLMKVNIVDKDGVITGTKLEEDPYAFQKGLSKAQRNALKECISESYIAKKIALYLKAAGMAHLLPQAASTKKASSAQAKPATDWNSITPAQVPDYPALERVFWNLTKKQPSSLYEELIQLYSDEGIKTKNDLLAKITAWSAFVSLKAIYAPPKIEESPTTEPEDLFGS